MASFLVMLAAVVVVVPAWVCKKYAPPPRLTAPVALRYLLMCLAVFLCGLLAWQDPLLVEWAPIVLGGSAFLSGALVVVLMGELCPS